MRSKRVAREEMTVSAMIRLFCREVHGPRPGTCPSCTELLDYAGARLEGCPFQEGKTVCAKCPVHCYRADMRDRIREVMRYSGPRMLLRHPLLALLHVLDGRRKTPLRPQGRRGRRRTRG